MEPLILGKKAQVMLTEVIYPMLLKYDPSEKFGLCEDIKVSMYKIIREADYYSYEKDNKLSHLNNIDMEISAIKLMFDVSVEREQITEKKKAQLNDLLDELGRICGGLKRSETGRPQPVKKNNEFTIANALSLLVCKDFSGALRNFPIAERGALTKMIFENFYDIARYYRGYETTGSFRYLNLIDTAICVALDYVNIAFSCKYISRKKLYGYQTRLKKLGGMCGNLKKAYYQMHKNVVQ